MFSQVDKPHKSWDQNRPVKFFFIPAEKKLLIFYAGSSYRKKGAFAVRLKEDDGEFFCALGDSC